MTARFEELQAKVEEAKKVLQQAKDELLAYLDTTLEYEMYEEVEVYGYYGVGANRKLTWRPAKIVGWTFSSWNEVKEDPHYRAVMKRKDGTWSDDRKSYRPTQVRKPSAQEG